MNRKSKAITFASLGLLLSGTVLAANMPRGIPEPNSPTMATPSDKRPVLTENSVDFGAYDPH
ncbi:beta-mannosidase, partial [Sinorhizobium meliloti]